MRPGAEQIDDPYVIQTDSISKNFGAVRAVRKLSISIPKRGLTSIAGPNGSGKSTLVNLLSGVLPLDGGIVVIDGASVKVVKAHENPAHGLTRTFQEVRLFDQVTVWDNLMVVLTERRLFPALLERVKPVQRDKVRGILEDCRPVGETRCPRHEPLLRSAQAIGNRPRHGHGGRYLPLR